MTDKQTGGTAFPVSIDLGHEVHWSKGMTLRDYFAAKAMQADITDGRHEDQFAWCAGRAYKMADAMLVAREDSKRSGV
jgi:hypothetical protein